jgi:ribonucleoside-triphosphate reductase
MVMGYHRPLESFNKGKKEEYYERKCFTEEKAVEHLMLDNALAAE